MIEKRIGTNAADFETLQQAIDSIPADHAEPVRLILEPGIYREKVVVNKDHVEIIGHGAEVVWGDYALQLLEDGTTKNTFLTATLLVTGTDVTLRGLTVRNDAGDGREVGQAVAVYAAGDQFRCFDCRFFAAQDTLYTGPVLWKLHHHTSRPIPLGVENVADRPDIDARQYYENCWIQGDVDFIFGPYRCWFENCTLYANERGGYYTAPNTQMDQPFGLVFHRCRLTGECEKGGIYLGRPWREGAAAAFLHCEMDECVHPEGFCDWANPFRPLTRRMCEYGTTGVDLSSRNPASGHLTEQEAERYTLKNVLAGWNPKSRGKHMNNVKVEKIVPSHALWTKLADYAENCSWIAGKHVAALIRENRFTDWEGIFAALKDGEIVGYCTFLKTDYYPENRYSPWISSIFVDENHRGGRISQQMIEAVIAYAQALRFSKVYIPSDLTGFYEKYGFVKVDELVNYGGDIDSIFAKDI